MAIDFFAVASLGAYVEDSVSGSPDAAEWMSLMGTWGAFNAAPTLISIASRRISTGFLGYYYKLFRRRH